MRPKRRSHLSRMGKRLVISSTLKVHSFLPATYGNGPGLRACLWLQGCTLSCPGCFNPESHAVDIGEIQSVRDLANQILELPSIQGITVSGGEPLQQVAPLADLLRIIKGKSKLSVVVFTGYLFEDAIKLIDSADMRQTIDLLFAGPFKPSINPKSLDDMAHKTTHFFSNRYTKKDLESACSSELIIEPSGAITVTGIDPIRLRLA